MAVTKQSIYISNKPVIIGVLGYSLDWVFLYGQILSRVLKNPYFIGF